MTTESADETTTWTDPDTANVWTVFVLFCFGGGGECQQGSNISDLLNVSNVPVSEALQHVQKKTQNHSKCFFFIASDWQAVLGQLANGRTAEEFRGAKVQAGATQHPVSCQLPYSGANSWLTCWPMAPTCLDHALYGAEGGVGVITFSLLCLPATPEGFWLMPICLDGTYINHTLIESQVHSPIHMCLSSLHLNCVSWLFT